MNVRKGLLGLFLFAALLVAACGGAAPAAETAMEEADAGVATQEGPGEMTADDSTMAEEGSEEMMADDSMAEEGSGEMMAEEGSEEMIAEEGSGEMMADASSMAEEGSQATDQEMMVDVPDWFRAELIDVNTGEPLAVADLKGKVILVETMAIWCSNCLRQQQEVKALHEALGDRDGWVTLVLDIDPNEDAEDLKAYTQKQGFDWIYAVAPREVAREIGLLYGDQFLNPPSTPMLIVDQQGEVHLLPFGRKSAGDLQEALLALLDESM